MIDLKRFEFLVGVLRYEGEHLAITPAEQELLIAFTDLLNHWNGETHTEVKEDTTCTSCEGEGEIQTDFLSFTECVECDGNGRVNDVGPQIYPCGGCGGAGVVGDDELAGGVEPCPHCAGNGFWDGKLTCSRGR